MTDALEAMLAEVVEVCAPLEDDEKLLTTCIVTDGMVMVAHQGGKELFWSSYKTRCADRDTCPSLAPECEAASESGYVNHLLFSSEPVSGDNVWLEMNAGDLIGVDWRMRLHRRRAGKPELRVVS